MKKQKLIIVFLLLLFLVLLYPLYQAFVMKTDEEKAVDYIACNISEFEDDFHTMGYQAKVIPIEGRFGYENDGVLVLYKDNREYHFDIGFDYYELSISDEDYLTIKKTKEKSVLKCDMPKGSYPVVVGLNKSDENGDFLFIMHNSYDTDFVGYSSRFLGSPYKADNCIKAYYSAENLRGIYLECIALQEKLVEIYKEKGLSRRSR